MEQKTISIYGETYTMHIFLPEYVNECSQKQLKRVLREIVTTQYDPHKLESELEDILTAARYCLSIASTKTRIRSINTKIMKIVDCINEYTERIENYDS